MGFKFHEIPPSTPLHSMDPVLLISTTILHSLHHFQVPKFILKFPSFYFFSFDTMSHHDQPSSSSSFSPSINRDSVIPPSGSSSISPSASPFPPSTSSSSRVREEEDEQGHVSEQEENEQQRRDAFAEMEQQNNGGIYFRGIVFGFVEETLIRDDTCSCVIVVFTFWIFVSMTMILGVFGSVNLSLGPNCSYLIQPNPLFVQSVKVEELDDNSHGLTLYGFYKSPPLDVAKTWTETQNITVPSESHLESVYFLNKGSQINISYHVNPPGSFVYLVITQGNDGLSQWIDNPSYPNYTLSWNIIEGTGIVQQNISHSSSYYVAVGNTNSGEVEVQLNLSVKSSIYNTTEAYYKCTFIGGVCTLSVLFPTGNSVLLTSPDATMGLHNDWDVKLSYAARWATYIVGIVVMTVVMLAVIHFLNKLRCIRQEETAGRFQRVDHQRAPLLSHKDDDDLSTWGSSYDSASNDEKAFEDLLAAGCTEAKLLSEDGENGNNTRRLCAICFDGPRDCFFLPCGHCVACFACGDRLAEAAGACPICRRDIKKVRKIFTV